MPNEHVQNLQGVYEHTARVISGVESHHLELPTPCTEWNVRDLLNHTIGVMFGIARGVSGSNHLEGDAPDFTAEGNTDAAFAEATTTSIAAWSADGVFDGPVNIGAGDMPAEVAIGINMLDTLTHSWDIAEALGHDRSMDPALAEATLAASMMIVSDELREGRFAAAVAIADDAPAHDRLAAFLGRPLP